MDLNINNILYKNEINKDINIFINFNLIVNYGKFQNYSLLLFI